MIEKRCLPRLDLLRQTALICLAGNKAGSELIDLHVRITCCQHEGVKRVFCCREEELRKLNRRYQDGAFECVIIYGRRRVGKTALINESCRDKRTI